MKTPFRRLSLVALATGIAISPAAAHACGCGYDAPYGGVHAYHPIPLASYQSYPVGRYSSSNDAYLSSEYPSSNESTVRQRRPRPLPSQYYTPDESRVLYQPVVVPLDEFLSPGEPTPLTPEQIARQRAAAEARATPPQLAPATGAPATKPEADPFTDDATAGSGEAEGAAAEAPPESEAAEPAEDSTFTEGGGEGTTAEEPEAEAPPEAETTPEVEAPAPTVTPPQDEPADVDADPFE